MVRASPAELPNDIQNQHMSLFVSPLGGQSCIFPLYRRRALYSPAKAYVVPNQVSLERRAALAVFIGLHIAIPAIADRKKRITKDLVTFPIVL